MLVLDSEWPAAQCDGLRQCVKDNAVLGPGTGRWPGLGGWYLPVGDAGRVLGAALVQPAQGSDEDGRVHATALAALLGQALVRLDLARAMQAAQTEAQRQQLLNTFLAAISHDLRTPLAAIVGAGTLLQTQGERLVPDARTRLLASIVSESTRLATLTENTLQLVRLSSQARQPHPWESLEEMVGAAVARVRAQDQSHRVSAKVEPGLPLVRADPVLMGQLLANLLDNALKYSKAPVQVAARRDGERLMLCVKDRGAGIDPALRATLFQPFSRGDGAGAHGAGLGLALCQAIAQAHDGQLTVRARQGGGTAFCLALPVQPQPDAGAPS
jgi:two-component system sensor histidine kinase KdpD